MEKRQNSESVVVITGGQGGLGSSLAQSFRQAGYDTRAPGRKELDVTDESKVESFFAALPRIDFLIHNAGFCEDILLYKMPTESFERVLRVHLHGGFLVARAALKHMMKQRFGHIIFIGSRSARTGPKGQTNYAAAKAGLCALSQSIAKEYGARNVQSNVVLPGFLQTKMTRDLPEKIIDANRDTCSLRRFNTPENAAQFIVKIAELDHVSGQTFTLDSRIDAWC